MVCWCLYLCVSERKFQFNLFSDFSECFNEKTTSIRRGWTELSAKGEAAALHAETSQQSPSNPPPHPLQSRVFSKGAERVSAQNNRSAIVRNLCGKATRHRDQSRSGFDLQCQRFTSHIQCYYWQYMHACVMMRERMSGVEHLWLLMFE